MNLTEKKNLRRTCSGIGFAVFAAAALLYITSIFMSIISNAFNMNPLSATLEPIISSTASIVSIFIVGMLYCKLSSSDMTKLVPVSRVRMGLLVPLILIILTVSFVSSYMTDILLNNLSFIGITDKSSLNSDFSNGYIFILQIISVTIVPPLVEEFLFRGIILHKLLPYGSTFAIFVSSILFALLHGNIIQIPFAFLGALAMAFSVVKTHSLLPSIIAHFFINLVSVLLDTADYYGVSSGIQNTFYFILLFVIVLGGIMSAFFLSERKDFFNIKSNEYKFKECMGACFSSVGIIFSGISLILLTVVNTL